MEIFEIRVLDADDKNDMATMEYVAQEEDRTANDIIELVGKSLNYQNELEFQHGDNFIVIFPCSDDEGYIYDIYETREAYKNDEPSIDGGQCTGTINDALEMALNN